MYGSSIPAMQSSILSQIDQYAPSTTYDPGVIGGYKAICNTTASSIFPSPIGLIELLFMNSDGNGDIGITAALQHPLSQGRIYINSSDPMAYPVIDPNYLSNPAGMHPETRLNSIIKLTTSRCRNPHRRHEARPHS